MAHQQAVKLAKQFGVGGHPRLDGRLEHRVGRGRNNGFAEPGEDSSCVRIHDEGRDAAGVEQDGVGGLVADPRNVEQGCAEDPGSTSRSRDTSPSYAARNAQIPLSVRAFAR